MQELVESKRISIPVVALPFSSLAVEGGDMLHVVPSAVVLSCLRNSSPYLLVWHLVCAQRLRLR
jgi:hypothetical protein